MSFATSLAVIFVTMIRGTREHYRNGNVEDRFLKQMMILGFIGAICGAFISTHIDVTLLSFLFGVLCHALADDGGNVYISLICDNTFCIIVEFVFHLFDLSGYAWNRSHHIVDLVIFFQ